MQKLQKTLIFKILSITLVWLFIIHTHAPLVLAQFSADHLRAKLTMSSGEGLERFQEGLTNVDQYTNHIAQERSARTPLPSNKNITRTPILKELCAMTVIGLFMLLSFSPGEAADQQLMDFEYTLKHKTTEISEINVASVMNAFFDAEDAQSVEKELLQFKRIIQFGTSKQKSLAYAFLYLSDQRVKIFNWLDSEDLCNLIIMSYDHTARVYPERDFMPILFTLLSDRIKAHEFSIEEFIQSKSKDAKADFYKQCMNYEQMGLVKLIDKYCVDIADGFKKDTIAIKDVKPLYLRFKGIGKQLTDTELKQLKQYVYTLASKANGNVYKTEKKYWKGLYDTPYGIDYISQGGPDMLGIYLEQETNAEGDTIEPLPVSQFRPTRISKDAKNTVYYSLADWNTAIRLDQKDDDGKYIWTEKLVNKLIKMQNGEVVGSRYIQKGDWTQYSSIVSLGAYLLSFGKDEQGVYLSIYDIWDFEINKGGVFDLMPNYFALLGLKALAELGTPIHIYDRFYFTIQALQEELDRRKEEEGLETGSLDREKTILSSQQNAGIMSLASQHNAEVAKKLSDFLVSWYSVTKEKGEIDLGDIYSFNWMPPLDDFPKDENGNHRRITQAEFAEIMTMTFETLKGKYCPEDDSYYRIFESEIANLTRTEMDNDLLKWLFLDLPLFQNKIQQDYPDHRVISLTRDGLIAPLSDFYRQPHYYRNTVNAIYWPGQSIREKLQTPVSEDYDTFLTMQDNIIKKSKAVLDALLRKYQEIRDLKHKRELITRDFIEEMNDDSDEFHAYCKWMKPHILKLHIDDTSKIVLYDTLGHGKAPLTVAAAINYFYPDAKVEVLVSHGKSLMPLVYDGEMTFPSVRQIYGKENRLPSEFWWPFQLQSVDSQQKPVFTGVAGLSFLFSSLMILAMYNYSLVMTDDTVRDVILKMTTSVHEDDWYDIRDQLLDLLFPTNLGLDFQISQLKMHSQKVTKKAISPDLVGEKALIQAGTATPKDFKKVRVRATASDWGHIVKSLTRDLCILQRAAVFNTISMGVAAFTRPKEIGAYNTSGKTDWGRIEKAMKDAGKLTESQDFLAKMKEDEVTVITFSGQDVVDNREAFLAVLDKLSDEKVKIVVVATSLEMVEINEITSTRKFYKISCENMKGIAPQTYHALMMEKGNYITDSTGNGNMRFMTLDEILEQNEALAIALTNA